jgi:hypothetical protein
LAGQHDNQVELLDCPRLSAAGCELKQIPSEVPK